jgi:hypothetical protein
MSWPLSLLVGLLNGVLGAALTTFAADLGTTWHRVSNMEGGRGMLIAFVYLPLGFIAGVFIGIRVARAREVTTFLAGLTRLGVAGGVTVGLVAAALGLAWLTADHPPTLGGKELDLVFEVRLPPGYPVRDSLRERDFRVGVVVSSSDRAYANLAFDSVRVDGDAVIVPGSARLHSRGYRTFSVGYDAEPGSERVTQVLDLPLAPSPKRADSTWTDWRPLERWFGGGPVPDEVRAQVRYRIQPVQ